MFGFDSFEGLPQETNDTYNHPQWVKGYCNINRYYRGNIEQYLTNFLACNRHSVTFIKGWFTNTLSKENITKYNFKPASFIDLDADIYTSTYQALDFMFANDLVQKGTLFGYDDWGGTPEYLGG